jgi:hypothetical protein
MADFDKFSANHRGAGRGVLVYREGWAIVIVTTLPIRPHRPVAFAGDPARIGDASPLLVVAPVLDLYSQREEARADWGMVAPRIAVRFLVESARFGVVLLGEPDPGKQNVPPVAIPPRPPQ